jgi:hypothetical protein
MFPSNDQAIITMGIEVHGNVVNASELLLAKYPDTQTWFIRIGHRAVYRFGSRSLNDVQ